jgi:hypothetical protein
VHKPFVSYARRPDAAPEEELSALTSIFRLALDSRPNTNAVGVPSTNGDDAMKGSKGDRARTIIRERN